MGYDNFTRNDDDNWWDDDDDYWNFDDGNFLGECRLECSICAAAGAAV